jgi:hydroxymethylbilane synthase
LTPGLAIGAFTERIDPRETLVSQHGETLAMLPAGALVGTSSPRRRFQLSALRSDLRFDEIRGNVDTRIAKVREGRYQATVMAAAGLIRMGLLGEAAEIFSLNQIFPAAGQGALAVQCRQDDSSLLSLLQKINHEPTERAVSAERRVLELLEVGCSSPVGVLAVEEARQMSLRANLYEVTTGKWHRVEARGRAGDWRNLADEVATSLKRN